MPGTITGLPLGVAHRLIAVRFASCRHPVSFRYVTHGSGSAARVAPVGHSLLFAVGFTACRFRPLNEIASPIVPAGTTRHPPSSGGNWNVPCYAAATGAAACLPQRNSLPSAHMRCRITASLRATATRARAMPRRLAIPMPHARRIQAKNRSTTQRRAMTAKPTWFRPCALLRCGSGWPQRREDRHNHRPRIRVPRTANSRGPKQRPGPASAVPSDTAQTAPTMRDRHLQIIAGPSGVGAYQATCDRTGPPYPSTNPGKQALRCCVLRSVVILNVGLDSIQRQGGPFLSLGCRTTVAPRRSARRQDKGSKGAGGEPGCVIEITFPTKAAAISTAIT